MDQHQRLIFIGVLLQDIRKRNYVRLVLKNLRDSTNPFEIPDAHFGKAFRLDKISVLELIDNLQHHVMQLRRDTIPLHLKVLATLNFLGTGSFQNCIGFNNLISVSQPVMSRVIREICTIISNHFLERYITFCTTRDEKNSIKKRFYEKWGARGVIGCIDGTHVEIIAPPVTDALHPPFVYINRKGKFSINVMLICDSDSKIIGCNSRYPGSVHDAAIWQTSNIRKHLMDEYTNGDKHTHLIGDSGYPLELWLFTPINNARDGSAESRFNKELTTVRNVIERTNGLLKSRFRCLSRHRVLLYHPVQAAKIIHTCCVLHNIAIKAKLPIPDSEEQYQENENGEEPEEPQTRERNDVFHLGRLAREEYIRNNIDRN